MNEVTLDGKRVQIIGFISVIPISLLMILPFWFKWNNVFLQSLKQIKDSLSLFDITILDMIIKVIAPTLVFFIVIIMHELIHGFFMRIFAGRTTGAVKFGFRKELLMPYAHCLIPLMSWQMLIITLAPLVILGLIPFIISMINGNLILLFIGFSMTIAAVGDILYAYLILKKGINIEITDHDTELGFKY